MAEFFKRFGKGILYVLFTPVFLLVLALFGVAGILMFIFLFFKSIFLFFSGRSLKDDLPEDKKAKEIIDAMNPMSTNNKEETDILTVYPSQSDMYESPYSKMIGDFEEKPNQEEGEEKINDK